MREALLAIIKDEKRVITGNIEKQYLSDNLGRRQGTAAALVFPLSTEEVSQILKYAYENSIHREAPEPIWWDPRYLWVKALFWTSLS